MLVAVTKDGSVFLKTTKLAADVLPSKVKDMLTNKLDKTVYLRADSRARYEKVVEVVDNLRAAGVDQLGLLTEEKQEEDGEQFGSGCRRGGARQLGGRTHRLAK